MAKFRFSLGRRGARRPSFYTILFVPHSRSRFRKLHVSRGFLLSVGAVAVLLFAAALTTPHFWFRLQTRELVLDRLAEENTQLREEKTHFESTLARISERLGNFEQQSGQLADALGLEPLPDPAGGSAGGAVAARSLLDEELRALDSRSNRLESAMDHLDEAFQTRARLLDSTPGIMPLEGWFSHGYGWRKDPFTGKRQFHRGIDIVNHAGSPIVATANGVVSRALRDAELGKTVDVSHGYGFVTRYAHMSELLVRAGDRVERGQIIGRVGSTGRSTGPHLHYEVFRDGRRVNPWKYLGQRGG